MMKTALSYLDYIKGIAIPKPIKKEYEPDDDLG
jgi:hypothetical protein